MPTTKSSAMSLDNLLFISLCFYLLFIVLVPPFARRNPFESGCRAWVYITYKDKNNFSIIVALRKLIANTLLWCLKIEKK